MGRNSAIGWTHHTFNPWWGCDKVSPGCAHCYAEDLARRYVQVKLWDAGSERRMFGEHHWSEPMRWNAAAVRSGERERVFCGSMCDWLEDRDGLLAPRLQLIETMRRTPALDWLLLSKRPENFQRLLLQASSGLNPDDGEDDELFLAIADWIEGAAVPASVWFGVSAEDQVRLHERVTALRGVPAELKFLSIEPLLGPVDAAFALGADKDPRIDWVIIGCESGRRKRPCLTSWVRDIVAQCRVSGTPVYVKQLEIQGAVRTDPKFFPEDLRIQEFPASPAARGAQPVADGGLFGV